MGYQYAYLNWLAEAKRVVDEKYFVENASEVLFAAE